MPFLPPDKQSQGTEGDRDKTETKLLRPRASLMPTVYLATSSAGLLITQCRIGQRKPAYTRSQLGRSSRRSRAAIAPPPPPPPPSRRQRTTATGGRRPTTSCWRQEQVPGRAGPGAAARAAAGGGPRGRAAAAAAATRLRLARLSSAATATATLS